jgi:hypothetical protein
VFIAEELDVCFGAKTNAYLNLHVDGVEDVVILVRSNFIEEIEDFRMEDGNGGPRDLNNLLPLYGILRRL